MLKKTYLRFGALALAAGLLLQIIGSAFHPHQNDPSDSIAAFAEYAKSPQWIAVHYLQFFAAMITVLGFLGLNAAAKTRSISQIFTRLGAIAVIVTIATVAILQAIDGVALKFIVDKWASAPEKDKETALLIAESVRWIEIGVNSYFRIMLGVILTFYGIALAAGGLLPKWLGWSALVTGLGLIAGGFPVGYYGFTQEANQVGMYPAMIMMLWMPVAAWLMWKAARKIPPMKWKESAS